MTVMIEKNGYVWTIIANRPDHQNAADPAHADALNDAFLGFEQDDNARVAVFTGNGRHFCAGWDLKYASSLSDPARLQDEVTGGLAFADTLANSPRGAMGPTRLALEKPVIAAIEGAAVAGGMELALWCDMRVMAETAYLGVYCRRWGLPLLDGGTVRLPRLVGEGKALEIIMTGRKVAADECYRIGLCEHVTPQGGARQKAEQVAHDIARFSQHAVRADRRSVIDSRGMSLFDALRHEWDLGTASMEKSGFDGAAQFRDGAGRGGSFDTVFSD